MNVYKNASPHCLFQTADCELIFSTMCDSKVFEDTMDFLLLEPEDIASFVDISTSKALPPEDQQSSGGVHSKVFTETDQLMEQVHCDQVIDSLPYDNDAWQEDGTMTPFMITDSIKHKLHNTILSRCIAEGKKLTLDQRRANKVEDKVFFIIAVFH